MVGRWGVTMRHLSALAGALLLACGGTSTGSWTQQSGVEAGAPVTARGAADPFDRAACGTGPVVTVVSRPGYFEGVTASPQGDIYTSDQTTLNVYRITPAGMSEVIAHLYDPPDDTSNFAGTFGMTFSPDGTLWIVVYDYWEDSRNHGIWRVDRDGSSTLAYPLAVGDAPIPNALVFDDRGNLYITESATGTIWRVARGDSAARPWLQHEKLVGVPPPDGIGIGANGITFKNGALYVANSEQGTVVRIPVDGRGDPGAPTIFATGLDFPDGLGLGPWKDIYAILAFSGQLVRVADDGTSTVVAETGLPLTTSLVFGTGIEHTTAYIVNVLSSWEVPMLVKVDVCDR